MRMHHQKTGGNRNAGRNTVSVSMAVLLALVMLAAGVCGGFLLTREPEPAAFESTTRARSSCNRNHMMTSVPSPSRWNAANPVP